MANTANKVARDSTLANVATANQGMASTLIEIRNALQAHNTAFSTWAGNLSTLTTGEKTSLVAAINWLLTQLNTHKNSTALHDVYALLDEASTAETGSGIHNSLYRGKNLGSGLTSDQLARVNDGTFKGLWLGDYVSKSVTTNY